jgi:DNA-binding CsgD family transcriptional regulator/tetratricopeptide (TPR) repeat protein
MLLERENTLDAINASVALASAGHGRVVVVEGEAGIGKTSLLHAFAEQAGPQYRFLWGWCEALITPRPLGPVHDMAAGLEPAVSALLEEAAVPDRLFPALLHALQHSDETTVLVFEDMHWADNATLDLVKYLGRRVSLLPAALLLSVRSDEIHVDHPLTQVLGDLPAGIVVRVPLRPLSVEGVAKLAQEAGRPVDDLHGITQGNPFFVAELLSDGEIVPGRLPGSIRDAVWARLSRLDADERRLLDTVSITPGGIEPWLIRHLVGGEADSLIDRSEARGLLRRDGQGMVTFRHELAREAVLEGIAPSLQRSLHARMEMALSALPGLHADAMLSRRVHHADGAGSGERVLNLAPCAAQQASRVGAHREAAAHLATALRYVGLAPPELAAQLYDDWAYEAGLSLLVYADVIEARHQAIAIWRQLGRPDKVSANMRWLSRLHWRQGNSRLAEDCADEAVSEVEALPPGRELALAYSTRSQLHMLHYRFDEAVEWGERAIALADRLGETGTRVHALNNVGAALMCASRAGGRERLQESLSLSLEHGLHDDAARAYTNFAECAAMEKDFQLAEGLLSQGIAFCVRHDLDSAAQYLIGRQAQLRLDQGRFREAKSIAEGVMAQDRLPMVMHLPAMTVLAIVRMRLGEGDAPALLERTLREGLVTGEPQRIVPVRLALVEAAWLAEDVSAAQQQLAALAAMDLANFRPWDLGELAVWWRRCGIEEPLPAVGQLPSPRAAELDGDPQAAAREWTRLGLPYEAALSALQATGAEAEEALIGAVVTLETLEASPAAALARKLAQRHGLAGRLPKMRRGPYTASRHHPLGLTQHEQRVLALIAQGIGNKEIARRMSRSPRTIEHHVSAVLGKFNAANRMEILLRLRGEPWLLPDNDLGLTSEAG